jgi:exonuclease SbcC
MRPLALDIQGFTAFRELQNVDFRDLDLFVITGPTGSGKTSLLDAMIFALYGKVPRAGAQSVRDLVSHGMVEARVRLEFELDGERYQIARRLPRNGAQTATLERAEGDDWRSAVDGGGVRHVNESIEQLLKLPFDAFTRAVVLPQGEFHRFLKGERDARRQILTQLLGLGHYIEMGRRARGRGAQLRTKIETTQTIINEQYGNATDAEHTRLAGVAAAADARAATLQDELEKANEIAAERGRLAAALDTLTQRATDMQQLENDLAQAKDAYTGAQDREQELARTLSTANALLERARTELTRCQRQFEDVTARCGTLERIAQAQAALERSVKASSEYDKGSSQRLHLIGELETLSELVAAAGVELKGARERLAEAEREQARARALSTHAEERARVADARVVALEKAEGRCRQAETDDAAARERLMSAERANQPAAEAATVAAQAVDALERTHLAAAAAAGLQPGDPCPICERPLEAHPQVVAAAAAELDPARADLEMARNAGREADREMAAAQEGAQAAEIHRRSTNEELAALIMDDTIAAIRGEADRARPSAAAAKTSLETADAELTQARLAASTAESVSTKASADVEGHDRLLAQVAGQLAGAARAKQEAAALLSTHLGDDLPSEPGAQLAAQREEVQAASAAVTTASDEADRKRDERDDLAREVADVREELSGANTALSALGARCEALAAQTTAVLRTVADDLVLPELDSDLAQRDEQVAALRVWCSDGRVLLRAAAQTGEVEDGRLLASLERIRTDNGLAANGDPMAAVSSATASAIEQRGASRQAADQMADRVQERTELEANIAEDAQQANLLEALTAELRNDRFVAFILQETFDLLAMRASEELLRISDKRYSLISEDGEFEVVDHANADETRGVNTLSGGETFLASLALALALSRHVGDLAMEGMGAKLEAVFIDEGFGSLDPETLEDVVDALERLREGNLLVGVISHVPLLSERIHSGLKVEKAGGWSSILTADEP